MHKVAAAHYKDKYGVDDYWLYHDALIQMTDERCIAWMKEHGLYERFINPLHGLNDTVRGKGKRQDKKTGSWWTVSTAYSNRVTGDSPEIVALDCHLNKDARDCAEYHAAITEGLETGDDCKFDMSTYSKLRDAYLKLLAPCQCCCTKSPCECGMLPPRRIQEDMLKCFGSSLLAIHKACGVVVEGLGNRNGARRCAATFDLTHERRGGKRPTHKERVAQLKVCGVAQLWVHPNARACWDELTGVSDE